MKMYNGVLWYCSANNKRIKNFISPKAAKRKGVPLQIWLQNHAHNTRVPPVYMDHVTQFPILQYKTKTIIIMYVNTSSR